MFVFIGLIFLLTILFLYWCFAFIPSYRTYRLVNKIHGPKGLPLIGNALQIGSKFDYELLDYFKGITEKFPRFSLIWLLGKPVILIQEPDDLAEILGNVTNIMKGFEYDALRPWLNEGLLTSRDAKWHSTRKLLTPTFHFRILEENLLTMQKHAKVLVNKLYEKRNEEINIHELVTLCALDTMCETAMGINLGAQDNPTDEYVKSIVRFGELVVFRFQNSQLHHDWLFNLTPKGIEFNKLLRKLHSFTEKIIREKKQFHKQQSMKANEKTKEPENYKMSKRKAFLDLLLDFDLENKLTDEDIRAEVDTFLFEGHDTTASAIFFTLFFLSIHQDVQAKVVEELDNILGEDHDGILTKQNLNNMKYLEKVIKESLRIYPSVPYFSRELTRDVHFKGDIILPAGTTLSFVPYIIHRKPELYPDPLKFDPERFSHENMVNRHPYAYLPFSAGPRNCIGQKFAMMELKVVVSYVIRSFRLTAVTRIEDIEVRPAMILRTKDPVYIRVSHRRS